jgi:hypothetical protein
MIGTITYDAATDELSCTCGNTTTGTAFTGRVQALDSLNARMKLHELRNKHADFGAMDTEGREAVYVVEEAVDQGKPFPFVPRASAHPLLIFNPFQLYSSIPGWAEASTELVSAARDYWTALTEEKLGIVIAR